ncbi:hypothetical protein EMPG_11252 [Blastomyces silverae]|uniref:Uncharacterized protein n=1 Tax=Blastomyces silverae TaxID=2060906 RepID=A0A0H1BS52_9EURO|nr:hypothetical protein EMPG_11252 [Blastomyces silverae]
MFGLVQSLKKVTLKVHSGSQETLLASNYCLREHKRRIREHLGFQVVLLEIHPHLPFPQGRACDKL